MKKFKTWIAALIVVSSLGFSASAQEPTVVEENWESHQQNVKIERKAGEGELNFEMNILEHPKYGWIQYVGGKSLSYGLTDNVQLDLGMARSKFTDQDFNFYPEDTQIDYAVGLQAKIYDQGGLTIRGKGAINGYIGKEVVNNEESNYWAQSAELGMAVSKELGEGLVFHHTGDIKVKPYVWAAPMTMSNGLEYQLNEDNAFKGYLVTEIADRQIEKNTVNLVHKNTTLENVTLLTQVSKTVSNANWMIMNQVDVNLIQGLTLTGGYTLNTKGTDQVNANLLVEKGQLAVKGGLTQQVGGNKRTTIDADLKYELNQKFDLKAGVTNVNDYFGNGVKENDTDVRVGVTYKL